MVDGSVDVVSGPPTEAEFFSPDVTFGLAITPFRTITWEDGGPGKRIECPAGTVGIVPANFRQRVKMLASSEYVVVRMRPELFERVAPETLPFRGGDLPLVRSREDPVAKEIALALAALAKDGPDSGDALLADCLTTALGVRVLQWVHAAGRPSQPMPDVGAARMRRMAEYIEANLHRTIRLEELAAAAALSPYHFLRAFRKEVGITPVRYVWKRRVERAKFLLRTTSAPLAVVALECGFSGQSHFTTVFKRETGHTPLQYRGGTGPGA